MEVQNLEKNNNRGLIILLMVLIVVVICLGGYIVYDKLLSNETKEENNNEVKDNTEIFEQIKNVVEDELYVLYGVDNINNITAEEKTRLAFDLYCGNIFNCKNKNGNEIDNISASNLESVYDNSSLSNFAFENTSIPCMLNLTNPNHYAWTYNSSTKTYNYTEEGHGLEVPLLAYKELLETNEKDGIYTISYRYLWGRSAGDIPIVNFNIYATYEDAMDYRNSLGVVEYNFQTNSIDAVKVKEFYENIPNLYQKLDIYSYSFKIENGKVKLTNFVRE